MVRFWFLDQDLFEVDPVRYRQALGEIGLTAYRQAVAVREHEDTFALQYVRERLAVLDGDTDRIVGLLGGDLTRPHQFAQVAEAMAELGRDKDVLAWCERGIAETQGWQTARLYDLACETHAGCGEPLEVLRLRRSQHERMPSLSSYHALRRAAEAVDAWAIEHDAARTALRERDPRAFIDALLSDGDAQLAWDTAQAAAEEQLGSDLWLRLAESRETANPADAATVYQRVGDQVLEKARPPCLRRRRTNPQARSKRRDGRRRPPGVRPTHRHTPRTTSRAPDPNHDARQRRPALSPSRRPRGTKLPGQSSLAAPRHFESAPGLKPAADRFRSTQAHEPSRLSGRAAAFPPAGKPRPGELPVVRWPRPVVPSAQLVITVRSRPRGSTRLLQPWQRHSEGPSSRESRSGRGALSPRTPGCRRLHSAPGLLGGRFRASTITCCTGTGRTERQLRPRLHGCRFARRSGHLVPAGTCAAPYRLYEGGPLVNPDVRILTPQLTNCRVSAVVSSA